MMFMATISNSKSNTLITGTSAADSIYNYGDTVTIDAYAGNDLISIHSFSKKIFD